MLEQQERFRTYCTLLHMRLCMPPSSIPGLAALTQSGPSSGGDEEQTEDSELRSSQLRHSATTAGDTRRSASDRYSYRAAVSQLADD